MKYRMWRVGKPVILVAAIAALGWVVMTLWNAVMPGVFVSVGPIDYWHAVGLLVLCRILFGGFRGGGAARQVRHWRRWEAMTPEEREQFKRSFSARYTRADQQPGEGS